MPRIVFFVLISLFFWACEKEAPALTEGRWKGHFSAMDEREIPFVFHLEKTMDGYQAEFTNADETVIADEVVLKGDSIYIRMPSFEGYFAGTFNTAEMQGSFIKESEERIVSFRAAAGEQKRFKRATPASVEVSGRWETYFSPEADTPDPAIGIFKQEGNQITGTFRTTKGDYRYLEGIVSGDSILLSTFDGAHLFLFEAVVRDSVMEGQFYSGDHYKEAFEAVRNPDFELKDEGEITHLKEGYETIAFSFPNENGQEISLSDPAYEGKVVLVQLMGSWCPNCLDETRFLSNYVNEHPEDDLEVIALAFEYAKTPEKAFSNIRRLKDRIGINYPILLAQYGTSSKDEAREKLPMLDKVWSYPTLIFIGKDGRVRDIHTGFNGPATGEKYEAFKTMFREKVNTLLVEEISDNS